jgi:DNA-binding phage protein
MVKARTGAERYLSNRLNSPDYRAEYKAAKDRIARIDTIVRSLDARRAAMGLTKAELARRAGMKPEAIRRLFSVERPNPTLSTLVALAAALDLEIRPEPLPSRTRVTASRTVASRIRARTA